MFKKSLRLVGFKQGENTKHHQQLNKTHSESQIPAVTTQVLPSKLSIPLSVNETLASLLMLQPSPELLLLNTFSDPLLPSPTSPATPFLYAAHTELISSGATDCSSQ